MSHYIICNGVFVKVAEQNVVSDTGLWMLASAYNLTASTFDKSSLEKFLIRLKSA